jgi:DNA repair protein RecO (recombination protein O)
MDESAHGIVLRQHKFSETSLVIRWITRDHGRIDTLARGALRPSSPFRGKIDLFYLADLSFARSRRSELHALRDLRLLNTFAALRSDLPKLRLACYASALISQTTEIGPPLPEIFRLLLGLLDHLALHQANPLLPLAFELKLLAALGQEPTPSELRLSPDAVKIANDCLNLDWHQLQDLPPHALQPLHNALQKFLEFNFGRTLPQRTTAV